jgi:hypothetical protein
MGRYKPVMDVTAFERQVGMHVSMGKKHTVYGKEGLSKRKTRFHIDLFVDLESITCDGTPVWEGDKFVLEYFGKFFHEITLGSQASVYTVCCLIFRK